MNFLSFRIAEKNFLLCYITFIYKIYIHFYVINNDLCIFWFLVKVIWREETILTESVEYEEIISMSNRFVSKIEKNHLFCKIMWTELFFNYVPILNIWVVIWKYCILNFGQTPGVVL